MTDPILGTGDIAILKKIIIPALLYVIVILVE